MRHLENVTKNSQVIRVHQIPKLGKNQKFTREFENGKPIYYFLKSVKNNTSREEFEIKLKKLLNNVNLSQKSHIEINENVNNFFVNLDSYLNSFANKLNCLKNGMIKREIRMRNQKCDKTVTIIHEPRRDPKISNPCSANPIKKSNTVEKLDEDLEKIQKKKNTSEYKNEKAEKNNTEVFIVDKSYSLIFQNVV